MAMDLRRPPVDILHMPAVHEGMSYIGHPPGWILRLGPSARIGMHAASDDPALQTRIENAIRRQSRSLLPASIEVRSSPVVLHDAKFAQGIVQLGERFLLNGASGTRVRNRFEAENTEEWRMTRYLSAFRRTRSQGPARIGRHDPEQAGRLDIAIEVKNGFNYYHFLTETLGHLAHWLDDDSGRPITMQVGGRGDVKSFIPRFIKALFPAISDRVVLEQRPRRYDEVRSVYSHQHYLYAARHAQIDMVLGAADVDPRLARLALDPAQVKRMAMHSFDSSLRMLRNVALGRMREERPAAMPRLIWMGREEGTEARARGISGHEPLLEELKGRGFELIAFETLSPIEQIAAMNRADVVIAPHGAGLANMVFARPDTHVIEIGTRQTQLHRWGDFLKCAHVAGCRYDTVFADVDGTEDGSQVPSMSSGHRGIRIGAPAIAKLIAILDDRRAQPSSPAPSHDRAQVAEA